MNTILIIRHLTLAVIIICSAFGQVGGQITSGPDFKSTVSNGFESKINLDLLEQPVLTDYLTAALYNNPRVAAAYALWQADFDRIAVVKGLPNPTLNLGYFLSNVETAVGPQKFKIGLMQIIPWLGTLKLDGKLQTIQTDIQLELLQNQIISLRYNAILVYSDYYFLQHSIDVTGQNIELVRNWEQVVKSKNTTTRASHPDLIKTQVELMKLEGKMISNPWLISGNRYSRNSGHY